MRLPPLRPTIAGPCIRPPKWTRTGPVRGRLGVPASYGRRMPDAMRIGPARVSDRSDRRGRARRGIGSTSTFGSVTELYGANHSSYRGPRPRPSGTAYFWDDPGAKSVYTYDFYNRVGHGNGTATRSQSSDSVDECVPPHVRIQSADGQWYG